MDGFFLYPPGVIPVLINPIAVLLAVLPGIFMALISLLKPKSIKAGIIMLWRMKVQVILIAAVVYGLQWGVKTIFPGRGAEVGAAEAALVDWPHFQGSELRRGWINDGVGDPVSGGINWSFRDGNAQLFIASPAVVGNRIYIPSVTIGAFGGLSGAIYCLDADTGAMVWKGGPSDYRGSFSSAVVEGDRLVVGEGLHATRDARAVCMDISDENNPKVIWMYQVNSHIEGTPSIDQGRVFINAGDDGVYGLDLETGEKLWHLPGEDFNDVETSILAHDGKLYVGLGFGRYGQAVIQVDGATGEVLHRIETPYPVFSPPSIHEGRLYVGMGNGDFVFPAEQRVDYVLDILRNQGLDEAELEARRPGLAPGGAVWAFDIETMERVWEYETDRTILSAIGVSEQGLYFASRTGGIYHLDFDGNQLAYWNSGESIAASLAIAKNHVYAITSGGMLYVLDSDTLAPVWDLRLGTGTMFFSSPTVARGQIFVGTENAGMYSVGQPDVAGSVSVWSGDGGGPRRAGRADDAPLPGFGAYESHDPETAMGDEGETLVSLTPLVVDDLFARVFDTPTPRLVVGDSEHSWTRELSAPATGMVVHDDSIAITIGPEPSKLLLLHLNDGVLRHEMDLPADVDPLLHADAQGVWLQTSSGELTCLNAEGETLQRIAAASLSHPPVITVNQVIALRNEGNELAVLDRPTGKVLWSVSLAAPATAGPVLDGRRILVPTGNGLKAFGLDSGSPPENWVAPPEAIGDSLAMDRSLFALVTDAGDLLFLDRDTGAERARHPGALPGSRPLLERGRVFWLTESSIQSLSRDQLSGTPSAWTDFSWIGTPTTGMLAHRSKLYLGLTDWGLTQFGEEQ